MCACVRAPVCGRVPSRARVCEVAGNADIARAHYTHSRAHTQLLHSGVGAAGVVAGSNYRFGYRAAGGADELRELAEARGMAVEIVDLVGDDEGGGGGDEGARPRERANTHTHTHT